MERERGHENLVLLDQRPSVCSRGVGQSTEVCMHIQHILPSLITKRVKERWRKRKRRNEMSSKTRPALITLSNYQQ